MGELLRREGLYSSHLSTWHRERERGELEGLGPRKRGRKAAPEKALVEENARLAREVARLEKRLAQAEAIIEVQKNCLAAGDSPESYRRGRERVVKAVAQVQGWGCRGRACTAG